MARVPVYMPKFGMTMTHGLIVEWYFGADEWVTEGQGLLAMETEKVNVDIKAPATGRLVDIQHHEEAEVPVGEIVAYIETD